MQTAGVCLHTLVDTGIELHVSDSEEQNSSEQSQCWPGMSTPVHLLYC